MDTSRRPWEQREEWVAGRLSYSFAKAGVGLFAFAVLWCGVVAGIAYAAFDEAPRPVQWLLIAFGVLGALLVFGSVRAVHRGSRFRVATLVLSKTPIEPGSGFEAVLETERVPEGPIRATLSCRQGVGRSDERVLWRADHEVAVNALRALPQGVGVPVSFAVPPDARETDLEQRIRWRLTVDFNVVDSVSELSAHFEVPVFKRV